MIYTVDASADEPIMLLNKHIGYDEEDGMGIDGSLFQQELLQLDNMGKKAIQVWINCPGGSVVDGFNIYNAILKSKTPVDTYNVGIAASMGGVVFMAGRNRKMADYSLLMIHSPSGGENQKVLDAMSGSLVKMISAKSHTPEEDVKVLMRNTSWLTAADCLGKGFCTDIEITRQSNMKISEAKAMWKDCTVIVNSILKQPLNKKLTVMNKVTMKLGLVEAATEDNIIEAIKVIENKAYVAETKILSMEGETARKLKEVQDKADAAVVAAKAELATVKDAAEKAEADLLTVKTTLTKTQSELKAIKDKYDAMEAEKNAAIAAENEAKAKALVDSHVRTGRIKNEAKVIERWVNLAKDDFEGTEEMINAIPLSVKSPVIITGGPEKAVEGVHATSAMALAVKNKLKREGKLV